MNAVQEFISITPWTIIFQICNLLILFTLIRKLLFKRVMAVLDKRQQEIDGIYSAADKAKDDADQMKAEYTRRMSSARAEADMLVKNAMDTAQRRGDAIVQEARDEATHLKQKAESDIEQERRKAYSELVDEFIKKAGEAS